MPSDANGSRHCVFVCSLRTTGYPYVALLAFSGNRTKLIVTVEGRTSASQLQAALQQAVAVHEGHLAVEQADANERVRCTLTALFESSVSLTAFPLRVDADTRMQYNPTCPHAHFHDL